MVDYSHKLVLKEPKGLKGTGSWVRRKFRGFTLMPNVGYGSNKKTGHYLPNSFKKFVVHNAKELEIQLYDALQDTPCEDCTHYIHEEEEGDSGACNPTRYCQSRFVKGGNVVREDTPEEATPQVPLPPLVISDEVVVKFNNDYSTRIIVEGKQFNFELFFSNGLNITALFRRQGIINFLSIRENVYPCLVRLFYANLHHPMFDNGYPNKANLLTLLNGRKISFNKVELAEIFGFPTNNVTEVPSNFGNLFGFEKQVAKQIILKQRYRVTGYEVKGSMLKLQSRLIHSIIRYSIVSRWGN
ncbi:hypothetical protein LguiB_009877 [Lonicera macranthoides]